MSEASPPWSREKQPAPEQADVFSIEPAVDEKGEILKIEDFILSSEGRQEMNAFITQIDESRDIPMTLARLIQRALAEPDATIALLLSDEGKMGLGRSELTALYRHNSAMNTAMHHIHYAKHQGDVVMQRLYGDTFTVLAHLTRYEALHGAYIPDGDIWQQRAASIPLHRGKSFTQYHPHRYGGQQPPA